MDEEHTKLSPQRQQVVLVNRAEVEQARREAEAIVALCGPIADERLLSLSREASSSCPNWKAIPTRRFARLPIYVSAKPQRGAAPSTV